VCAQIKDTTAYTFTALYVWNGDICDENFVFSWLDDPSDNDGYDLWKNL